MGHKVDCLCGSVYKTPHGRDDARRFAQWHVSQVHKDKYPNGITWEQSNEFVSKE